MDDLNVIGLILDMLGVALVFFGYPQPSHEEGVRFFHKRYRLLARAGLVLMFFGFLLQLIAHG